MRPPRIRGTLAAALVAVAACSGPGDRQDRPDAPAAPQEAAPLPPDTVAADEGSAAAVDGAPAEVAEPVEPAEERAAAAVSGGAPAASSGAARGFTPPMARRPYRDDIPRAPMGTPKRATILDGKDVDRPVDDPEADSVQRGRRLVDPVEGVELEGGYASAEALAQAVLDRITWNEVDPLLQLRISKAEFRDLFWPEFPTSRPATNIQPEEAWSFHDADSRDGVTELLALHGGKELHLSALRYETGFAPYTNFNLYRGVAIEAVNERGDPVVIRAATTFAERNGRWRIFTFKG